MILPINVITSAIAYSILSTRIDAGFENLFDIRLLAAKDRSPLFFFDGTYIIFALVFAACYFSFLEMPPLTSLK
jgi:hypothetical protein